MFISFFLKFNNEFHLSFHLFLDGLDRNQLGEAIGGELGGALAAAESCGTPPGLPPSPSGAENMVSFVLMTRKGNKPQFKPMAVPCDSDLALNLRNREEVTHPPQMLS